MRVAYNGAFWGSETTGSGQYLHHLLAAMGDLSAEGWHAHLCCPPWVEAPSTPPISVQSHSVAVPAHLDKNLAKLWWEQIAFPQSSRQFDADLVHVPYFAPPLVSRRPLVVTIFDLIPLLLPLYRGSRLVRTYMRLVSTAARRADLVLTDSYSAANDIERLLGIDPKRIRPIHLAAADSYQPVSEAERQPVLDALGINGPYLLYLGGFDRRKNVIGILRALARVRDRLGDVRLVIAGRLPETDTSFAPDPRVVSSELSLDDRVHYTGWVAEEDKPALYSGALGFLFPSFYEGFGLPVLEAISCGIPAVVGKGSSLEEVAGDGGLVVAPDEIGGIAQAMDRLIHDDSLRSDLSEAGLAHARRFSWRRTAQQTWDAYQSVLSGSLS